MNFWNKKEQVDQPEAALLGNACALVLHFLDTAPGESVAALALAGESFAQASPNVRAPVTSTLVDHPDQLAAVTA